METSTTALSTPFGSTRSQPTYKEWKLPGTQAAMATAGGPFPAYLQGMETRLRPHADHPAGRVPSLPTRNGNAIQDVLNRLRRVDVPSLPTRNGNAFWQSASRCSRQVPSLPTRNGNYLSRNFCILSCICLPTRNGNVVAAGHPQSAESSFPAYLQGMEISLG